MSLVVHSRGGWGFLKGQGFVVKEAGTILAMGDTGDPREKALRRKRARFLLFLLPTGFLSFSFLSFILSFYSMGIEPRALCRLGKHSPGTLLPF